MPRNLELPDEEIAELIKAAPRVSSAEAAKRANRLLAQIHIQNVLEELERSPSEHARQQLSDNILFGSSTEKQKAVEQILKEEDKLGLRDAAERWADIMCDIGAEVVFPLGIVTREVQCTHCGQSSTVQIDVAAEIPLSEFLDPGQMGSIDKFIAD